MEPSRNVLLIPFAALLLSLAGSAQGQTLKIPALDTPFTLQYSATEFDPRGEDEFNRNLDQDRQTLKYMAFIGAFPSSEIEQAVALEVSQHLARIHPSQWVFTLSSHGQDLFYSAQPGVEAWNATTSVAIHDGKAFFYEAQPKDTGERIIYSDFPDAGKMYALPLLGVGLPTIPFLREVKPQSEAGADGFKTAKTSVLIRRAGTTPRSALQYILGTVEYQGEGSNFKVRKVIAGTPDSPNEVWDIQSWKPFGKYTLPEKISRTVYWNAPHAGKSHRYMQTDYVLTDTKTEPLPAPVFDWKTHIRESAWVTYRFNKISRAFTYHESEGTFEQQVQAVVNAPRAHLDPRAMNDDVRTPTGPPFQTYASLLIVPILALAVFAAFKKLDKSSTA